MSQELYPKCIGRQDAHWGQGLGHVKSGIGDPHKKPEEILHMRRPATARVHLPGLVAYVWGKWQRPQLEETGSTGCVRMHLPSPAAMRSFPKLRGPGGVSCPALSLDRGPERLGNLPKFTQLWLPAAMSLLCHPLHPQAEGSWLLLGARDGWAVPFHPGADVYTGIQGSRDTGRPAVARRVSGEGRKGQGMGKWREERKAGPQGKCGQGAQGAWLWL